MGKTTVDVETDFLFAQPSFASGLARVLDLFGLFDAYNECRSGVEADARAVESDWRIVGRDIRAAASKFEAKKRELARAK